MVAERVEVLPRERDLVEVCRRRTGCSVISPWSLFVGARMSQTIGAMKKRRTVARTASRTPARAAKPHQSSVLKSPLRVTISTAPTRPIMSRSTAIAAAPLKSAYRKASW